MSGIKNITHSYDYISISVVAEAESHPAEIIVGVNGHMSLAKQGSR
jgi:hypothetical protein